MQYRVELIVTLVACTVLTACSPGGTKAPDDLDGSSPDAADAGGTDAGGTGAGDADVVCRAIEAEAERLMRPADVIMMIDSTGSMGDAVDRIEEVVNRDFAAVLDASSVDYQVILLASSVRLRDPLASSGRLRSIDMDLGSGDRMAFRPVLNRLDEWGDWLRPEAVKVFLHFTDSVGGSGGERIEGYDSTFDEELTRLAPEHFGPPGEPTFIYHAINGLAENDPRTEPWPPTAPIVTEACTSGRFRDAPGPGPGFQRLAVLTGGLRFPVCRFDDFDVVFHRIADDVVDFTAAPCTFALPTPPDGEMLDLATVAVRWRPAPTDDLIVLRQAPGADDCTPGQFYLSGDSLELCPGACTAVQAAAEAEVEVVFGCDPSLY